MDLNFFRLRGVHVTLHDAPCLLAIDVLGVEVEVVVDNIFVVDVDVLQAIVPEFLPTGPPKRSSIRAHQGSKSPLPVSWGQLNIRGILVSGLGGMTPEG